MPKQRRRIYCKFCDYFCFEPEDYVSHLEKHHYEMIPEDMSIWQFSYFLRTGKKNGNCVVCKKPTTWNEKTHKYNRFCGNPKCKEKYREVFKNRMIGKYGKTHLLNDPEQQKKMLAHRKISGTYVWRDRVSKFTYTGSYEKAFLEFLDQVMNFDSGDLMAPSPHTYYYTYEGEKHFYIPDFFIPSLNLEIEIKDGGDNANKHPKIQAVDKVKEKLKDEVMMKNQFNYIKIVNQEHEKFFKFLNQAKYQYLEKDNKPIYMVEKEMTLEDLNELYTESSLYESKNNSHIDTVIFDLGSVLVRNTSKENVSKTKIPEEYIEQLAYTYFSNAHGTSETMTVSELLNLYKSKLDPELKQYAKEALELFATSKKPFGYTIELIKSLKKKGYNVYYLSNWNKSSFTLCKEKGIFDFLKLFDGGIMSYEVNMIKPNKNIYKLLLKKYNLIPENCLFYDDKQVNIDTANELKIHGKLFSYKNHTEKEIFKLPDVEKSVNESLDTLLTTNPFIKEITLYHGSDKLLNTINPVSKNAGNKFNKNIRLSSFWGDDFEWCKYWALGIALLNNGCKLLFNNFLDKSRKYDKDFIVVKDNFNEVLDKVKDKNIYVYTKTIDKKYVGRGHTPAYSEYTIDIPVKPDNVNEFTIKEIINNYTFEILDINTYKDLCKIVKNDVMTTKPISQFYKYNEYEKRERLKNINNL